MKIIHFVCCVHSIMHNVIFQYYDGLNILEQLPLPYFASSINYHLIFKCYFFSP